MKRYKLTPLNIISILIIGWIIVNYFKSDINTIIGWKENSTYYLIAFGVVGLIIDFIIQFLVIKKIWIYITESSLILMIVIILVLTNRTRILITSNQPTSYIVIVYGVENQPKLYNGIFSFIQEERVPDDGILLTSTSYNDDYFETIIKTPLDENINSKKYKLRWIKNGEGENRCGGKYYKYRKWVISECIATALEPPRDNSIGRFQSLLDTNSLTAKLYNKLCSN